MSPWNRSAHVSDGLTIRIGGLPPETIVDDVARFFNSRIGPSGSVISNGGIGDIAPEVNRSTKHTTVTFTSRDLKKSALQNCNDVQFSAQMGNGTVIVNVEDQFMGLTTLHAPEDANVDIVALHGLSGHAWDTFASSHSSWEGIKETCWLRDQLPKFMEGQVEKGLKPRVMTYGYNANIWINSTIDGLDTPVTDLIQCLDLERKQDPQRPLIFIGHSLGGIIIKQVVNDMITRNKQRDPTYSSPIRACLFLAVPHRGTGNADFFGKFLETLNKVLPAGTRPNNRFVEDLKRKTKKIADITDRFIQILNANQIQIIDCYENKDYSPGKGKIVSKESATLDFAGMAREPPIPIDAPHTEVARFGHANHHPFVPIASKLLDISYEALLDLAPQFSDMRIQQSPQQAQEAPNYTRAPPVRASPERIQPGLEPAFFKLTRYTTVFLVDDSSSMEDIPELNMYPWTETIDTLARCADLVLGAGGSLKVHFFNNPKVKEEIFGKQDLVDFCKSIVPKGDTPTYQKLKRHLDEFLQAFQPLSAIQRDEFPGLNLIIFTDGAPEGRFDDIEEVIVETAQDLDQWRADKYKLGIQWVQIGKDDKVAQFFDKIDDKIKGAHGLRRDVVDTTRYDPLSAKDKTYKKIVLGAIDKDWDDEATAAAPAAPPTPPSQPRFTPHIPQGNTAQGSMYSQHHFASQRTGQTASRQYTN